MRVIAGSARGRQLKGPASRGTRPMSDKIKGALFNALSSLGVAPERALDLYAGTGSIGIEALSRGAEWVDFVEQNAAAAAVVRDNLRLTKFADRAAVHQTSVDRFLTTTGGVRHQKPYDFVILDPPYADEGIAATLEQVGRSELVQSGAVVVIGHAPGVVLPTDVGRLTCLRHRCHGDSCYSIYEVVDVAPDQAHPAAPTAEDERTA
jgi:16S rRNA (guanine966-N2)-methyltransferase